MDAGRAPRALADAFHAVRKSLGRDAVVAVGDELRLNPAVLRTDVAELRAAIAAADHERAASLYRGPFLDGCLVPDAPELEHRVDAERTRIAGEYGRALAAAAESRESAGDWSAAVAWWRRGRSCSPRRRRSGWLSRAPPPMRPGGARRLPVRARGAGA